MATDFRVFLSAVSSEFGAARDALANDLQARDVQVRVQRSFRQEARSDTLLRLLHDYIRECSAVVCVIGMRSGACPAPAVAAPFAHLLPPGVTEASYTQWEFFLAASTSGGCRFTSPPPIAGRIEMPRPATISPNYRRPSSGTSRRRGCITPRFPTAISCAPRC
jgi:hypothetical protein